MRLWAALWGKATNPKKEEEICFRVPLYWLRSLHEFTEWAVASERGRGFGVRPSQLHKFLGEAAEPT